MVVDQIDQFFLKRLVLLVLHPDTPKSLEPLKIRMMQGQIHYIARFLYGSIALYTLYIHYTDTLCVVIIHPFIHPSAQFGVVLGGEGHSLAGFGSEKTVAERKHRFNGTKKGSIYFYLGF